LKAIDVFAKVYCAIDVGVDVLELSGVRWGAVYLIIVSLPSQVPLKFLSMKTIRPENIQSLGLVVHETVAAHDIAVVVAVVTIFEGHITA
jgi:hypothetical protein